MIGKFCFKLYKVKHLKFFDLHVTVKPFANDIKVFCILTFFKIIDYIF